MIILVSPKKCKSYPVKQQNQKSHDADRIHLHSHLNKQNFHFAFSQNTKYYLSTQVLNKVLSFQEECANNSEVVIDP